MYCLSLDIGALRYVVIASASFQWIGLPAFGTVVCSTPDIHCMWINVEFLHDFIAIPFFFPWIWSPLLFF